MSSYKKPNRLPNGPTADPPPPQVESKKNDAGGKPPRIVTIGASAGGLEPIEIFFSNMPETTGLSFVVVQHLSPDFRSMMPELLARRSPLNIYRIEDGMKVEPNTIYLNPPRASVSYKNGNFSLSLHTSTTEPNLPINDFLTSLAETAGDDAIAVILSGTGSDGTLGAQRVFEAGGLVLAQDPVTAKFDSMPRSVIETIPDVLFEAAEQLPRIVAAVASGEDVANFKQSKAVDYTKRTPEQEIIRQLQMRYGIDFGYYKTSTVLRRIERRLAMSEEGNIKDYAESLLTDPEELEELYTDLLIGVTSFFRDSAAYTEVRKHILENLLEAVAEGRELRIWAPGCASGEEAYSIAMMIMEATRETGVTPRLKIFATDIHPRSLRVAARGFYTEQQLGDIPKELRNRYFTKVDGGYFIQKLIRENIVFSKHNIIKDPPFTKLDLVSCRNLLIYLNEEAQNKVIAMFHFALKKDGVLFLGPSEALSKHESEFKVLNARWRVFKKRRDVRLVDATRLLPLTSAATVAHSTPAADSDTGPVREGARFSVVRRQSLLHLYDAVLAETVGTAFLVSPSGQLIHVFSDAAKFLSVQSGVFSDQISNLMSPDLRSVIISGLERVVKRGEGEHHAVIHSDTEDLKKVSHRVVFRLLNGSVDANTKAVLITITELKEPPHPAVVTTEAPGIAPLADKEAEQFLHNRISELERDLRFSEETLQTTIEELETSNEELQATNEELQATNEELMAANEELQTVNEELHAVNEELYTVSGEHQSKINELVIATGDLDNMLKSTDIGVVFLDNELNIRLVTPAISRTFNILERDISRPISHLTTRFEFPNMVEVINRVIRDNKAEERTISVDAKDYSLRILPYDRAGAPDGAVLTFIDITEIARANRSLAQFADVVSHDLKAPLRAIKTASNWIIEALGDNSDREVSENVSLLQEQTERLYRMLNSLKDFSSKSPLELEKETILISELLDDIVELYTTDQIIFYNENPEIEMETAKPAIRLVLQNLVENAVRHADVLPVTVTFNVALKDGMWLFQISDDGPGIDPRHHEKIFLPFRRLATTDASASGSGIGLALVMKTVRDFGGAIDVISEPAKKRGTTFSFTWPA